MAKIIVKTTGDFMLMSPADRFEIEPGRPYVVPQCTFIDTFAALGRVSVLKTDLPDSATDKDWEGFWTESEGNLDLAIDSFMSTFEVEKEEPALKGKKSKAD